MNFFWDPQPNSTFKITDEISKSIKQLKPTFEESGYYDHMVVWDLDNVKSFTIAKTDIWKAMQFITMTCKLKESFIKKHNVKDYHKILLKQLYIDIGELDDTGVEKIHTGYKRPFGNSHVLGDVNEVLIKLGVLPEDDEDYDEHYSYELENKVLKEFMDILISLFKEEGYELICRSFISLERSPNNWGRSKGYWRSKGLELVHSYLDNFIVDPAEERLKKIDVALQ